MITAEAQLFTFTGWDDLDTAVFQYYDAVLVKQVGDFSKGEAFEFAILDFQRSTLSLQRGDKKWKFNLILEIGDEICDETE